MAADGRIFTGHQDAVSCLSLDEPAGLFYSSSWDGTLKVWRVAVSHCLVSVPAHNDACGEASTASRGSTASWWATGWP